MKGRLEFDYIFENSMSKFTKFRFKYDYICCVERNLLPPTHVTCHSFSIRSEGVFYFGIVEHSLTHMVGCIFYFSDKLQEFILMSTLELKFRADMVLEKLTPTMYDVF